MSSASAATTAGVITKLDTLRVQQGLGSHDTKLLDSACHLLPRRSSAVKRCKGGLETARRGTPSFTEADSASWPPEKRNQQYKEDSVEAVASVHASYFIFGHGTLSSTMDARRSSQVCHLELTQAHSLTNASLPQCYSFFADINHGHDFF